MFYTHGKNEDENLKIQKQNLKKKAEEEYLSTPHSIY